MNALRRVGAVGLERLLRWHPGTAFAIAGWAHRVVTPGAVSAGEVGSLLGHSSANVSRRLAREINIRAARSHMVLWIVRRLDPDCMRPWIRTRGVEHLAQARVGDRGAIVLTWHTGPYQAIGRGLAKAGLEFFRVQRRAEGPTAERAAAADGGGARGAAALKRALAHLRAGGVVLMAGDGLQGETGTAVAVLGRHIVLRHGASTLARLGRVPILPIVASWQGWHIEVTIHPPLPIPLSDDREVDAVDAAVASAAGRWLDTYLRNAPHELRPDRVRLLLAAPHAGVELPAGARE